MALDRDFKLSLSLSLSLYVLFVTNDYEQPLVLPQLMQR